MEGYQLGGGGGRMGEKVHGIRSINGRYKTDRRRLRVVWEVEKPKNLYAISMDMNQEEHCWREGHTRRRGAKGEKVGITVVA